MRLTKLLLALSLLLTACAGTTRTDGYISRNTISVKFDQMDGVAGRWDHNNMTILLSSLTNYTTICHEALHACDSTGESLRTVLLWMGDVPGYPRHMAICKEVLAESERIGGKDAGWKALAKLYGTRAVYHPEILARMKSLNHLARK